MKLLQRGGGRGRSSADAASSSTSSSRRPPSLLTFLLLAPSLLLSSPAAAAASFDCASVLADDQRFDLSKLGGPHTLVTTRVSGPNNETTTWTLDLCKDLKRKGDVDKSMKCPDGTRVCGLEHLHFEKNAVLSSVLPVAGNLHDWGGGDLSVEAVRLTPSSEGGGESPPDPAKKRDGLRLVLGGGAAPLGEPDAAKKRAQRAVVDLVCDPKRTGLEGEWQGEDEYEGGKSAAATEGAREMPRLLRRWLGRRDDEKTPDAPPPADPAKDHQLVNDGAALLFDSYGPAGPDSKTDELRLTWYTDAACNGKRDDGSKNPTPPGGGDEGGGSHWGLFTWLVVIVFLAIASYLIFGSWLNYNRYGARGWDLLPHGDAIRDVPYLLKDWTRRVLNTVQGSGSRGGYSAV